MTVHDAESGKRKKPNGVCDLTVFSAIGDEPPQTSNGWRFAHNTTLTRTKVTFPNTLPPGTRVWLCAYWGNRRCEHGPSSSPVYTHLGYAVSLEAGLKAAA